MAILDILPKKKQTQFILQEDIDGQIPAGADHHNDYRGTGGEKVAFSLPENFRTAMGLIREKEILCTYDQTKI